MVINRLNGEAEPPRPVNIIMILAPSLNLSYRGRSAHRGKAEMLMTLFSQ